MWKQLHLSWPFEPCSGAAKAKYLASSFQLDCIDVLFSATHLLKQATFYCNKHIWPTTSTFYLQQTYLTYNKHIWSAASIFDLQQAYFTHLLSDGLYI